MIDSNIILPSKPKIIAEDNLKGSYEIEGLYPGYGHTLGNSLRRIILSSLVGSAITSVKVTGAEHEFSTLPGVKEDVIMIILALKKVRFQVDGDEPQKLELSAKGVGEVTAGNIKGGSQVKILNKDLVIANLADKKASLEIEITVEKGLGYVNKEAIRHDRNEIGTIFLDAVFTPIRQVSYEVENMRVGDRTNYNRLRLNIETDGTITPHEALEKSVEIMITQLKAIVGFKEPEAVLDEAMAKEATVGGNKTEANPDILKTRIEDMGLSARTLKALSADGIRTIGGLARKREEDLLEIEGLGGKSIEEIKELLSSKGLSLKA
ncbi:MAG: DNA-directed RNA polymerase subunit alpha [Patescibacteria group bacterium]